MRVRAAKPDNPNDRAALAALWLEYLAWANDALAAAHGVRLGRAEDAVAADLAHLDAYAAPQGALVLAEDDGGTLLGCAALRASSPGVGEIKRFYVRADARRHGAARAMLQALIAAAQRANYRALRLDSARFMAPAHALYRAHGFVPIAPYAESEIPPAYHAHWVFMQLDLAPTTHPEERDPCPSPTPKR